MCILTLMTSPSRGFPISRRCSSSVLLVIAPESVSNGFPLPGEDKISHKLSKIIIWMAQIMHLTLVSSTLIC